MFRVKRLAEKAFEVYYNDFVLHLSSISRLCKDSSRNGRNTKLSQAVTTLREKLDSYFVGAHARYRARLKQEYYLNENKYIDLNLFLDCILDDSVIHFICLEHHLPFEPATPEGKFYPVKLLEVLAKRSPLLQSLKLQIPLWHHSLNALGLGTDFGITFQKLEKLTELDLNWAEDSKVMASFFTALATSCPQLKHLKLGDKVQFGNKQQLALVLGKAAHFLPQFVVEQMDNLQFADEYVTPLCQSLESLTVLGGSQQVRYVEDGDEQECFCIRNTPSMVFLLRHIRQLRKMQMERRSKFKCTRCSHSSNCSLALQCLYKHSRSNNDPVRVTEMSWRDGEGDPIHLQWATNSPPRTLNLLELEGQTGWVHLLNEKAMDAVLELCPELKIIHFVQNIAQNYMQEAYNLTSLDLNPILCNRMRKVESVIFERISICYRLAVLSILGGQLKTLELHNCEALEMYELMPCVALEELVMRFDYASIKSSGLTVDKLLHFIPQLTSLKKLTIPDRLLLPEEKRLLVASLEPFQIRAQFYFNS